MDITTAQGRAKFIKQIESNANLGRKASSYKASQVLKDRCKPYVIESLREQFSEKTVKEMPIVSQVNVAKRVINKLASIYSDKPLREFQEVTEEQENVLDEIYTDMGANKSLAKANRVF